MDEFIKKLKYYAPCNWRVKESPQTIGCDHLDISLEIPDAAIQDAFAQHVGSIHSPRLKRLPYDYVMSKANNA